MIFFFVIRNPESQNSAAYQRSHISLYPQILHV